MAEAISQATLARAIELQRQAEAARIAEEQAAAVEAQRQAELTRSRTLGETASDAGLQLLSSAVGLGQAAYGAANVATLGAFDRSAGLSQNFEQSQQYLNSLKSAPTQARQAEAQAAFDNEGVLAGVGEYISSPALIQDLVLGSAASLIPASAAARGAAGAATAFGAARGLTPEATRRLAVDRAQSAVLRTTAAQTAGAVNVEAINAIREEGGTATEQQLGGLGAAALAGLAAPAIGRLTGAARFEAAAANALPGGVALGVGGNVVRGTAGGAVREGTEEYLQSGSEQLAQNVFTPNTGLFEGVGQQAALGAIAGTALGGGMGAAVPLSAPPPTPSIATIRTETPLRGDIRGALADADQELGGALNRAAFMTDRDEAIITPYLPQVTSDTGPMETPVENIAVGDTPLPGELPLSQQLPTVEEIQFGETPLQPLPGMRVRELAAEEIDLGATPTPLRSLSDITGRRPQVRQPVAGLPTVEELPAPQRTGLLGVIDAQTGRGRLGGTDLLAGPLDPAGAFPQPSTTPAVEPAPPVTAPGQQPLDFNAEPMSWKKALARDLGLKPASFKGKAWDQFTAAAEAAGVRPGDPGAQAFLSQVAPQVAGDVATAPLFAATLAARYAPAAPVTPPPPTEVIEVPAAETVVEQAAPAVANDLVGIDARVEYFKNLDASGDPESAFLDAALEMLNQSTDVDTIDQVFFAIKRHPEWKNVSEAVRNEITEDYDQRYDIADGTAPGKFDRGDRSQVKTPINIETFQSMVASANRARTANDAEIIPVEDVASYQVLTGQSAPADVRGVFSDGRVYLIRENIGSPKDLAVTLAHERGHRGLSVLLGDRLTAVTNRMWTNAALRGRIKGKMQLGLNRAVAAEEVLADMLAGGEKVNGDIIVKARSAINGFFADVLGYGDLTMDNAEIDQILRDVARVLRGESVTSINQESPEQPRAFMGLLTDPATATVGDARFSRAIGDVQSILAAADAEPEGKTRGLGQMSKDVGQASLDLVKSYGTATARDKARGLLLDATPLNQMVNLYGSLFDGVLNQFARLKRSKESTFNKALTAESELDYRGQTIKTSPQQLSNEWESFRRQNPARAAALDSLQQTATLYRLFPDIADFSKQSSIDYSKAGFTEQQRRDAHSDVRKLWSSVGDNGRKIYKESQAVYSSLWNRRFAALKGEISRTTGLEQTSPDFLAAYGRTIDAALNKMRQGPYSPLQRYGDYLVTVRDAEGKVAWFSGHETIEEASRVEADLKAGEFAQGGYRVVRTLRQQHDWQLDGINQATIETIEKAADGLVTGDENAGLRREIRNALVEAYLQSLPSGSFLQHANRRKNTRGATTDSFRAFNDYAIKSGRSIASLEFDGQISTKMAELQNIVTDKARAGETSSDDLTKLQRVLNAVRSQHSASLNFDRSPVADALSQGGFLWFMSSPSQLFINSMQTFMVTLPRLAGAYGNTAGIRGVKNALGAFAKSRGDLLGDKSVLATDSPERRVMDELYRRGVLDFTLAQDMTGLANGEGAAMSAPWRKTLELAGVFMHRSEVFNRQVTALAATRLEMEKAGVRGNQLTDAQLTSLADVAEDAVLTTQFDYSQSNKPKIMQGPWRKVIFQFQQYRVNMLAMMAKDVRDSFTGTKEEKETARRALAWLMGTQLALTGVVGTVLAPLAFAIADMFREDDDLLDSHSEFVRAVPQWLAHGVLAGAVDTSRIGADGLVSVGGQYAPVDASAKETFQYYVMQNIGPWAGLGSNIATGIEKALEGDHVAAVKGLAPAGIRDVYRAYFEGTGGAKDSRQVVYYEPSIYDTVLTAAGLRSGDRREAEELRGASYEASVTASKLKQRYLGRVALGHALGDQDLVNEGMAKIQEWNTSFPDMAVRASDIKRATINRIRSQANATEYGIASPRAPSESLKEVLAL